MFSDLKFVNELGGIQAERVEDGISVYLAPGTDLHTQATAGAFGAVAPYAPPPPPEPNKTDVQRERDRRILAGSTFTLTGYPNPVRLAGDERTTTNLHARMSLAQQRLQMGDTTPFGWRDEDNVVHMLTPAQIIELFAEASMFVDHVYHKSWQLIDNPPIPADYADDKHWT